ncbi:MAG TPA: hypothetical protein H9687_01795 [Firmicutes bacterium]|nr:hypothetical protein [Bacillota bacterium]
MDRFAILEKVRQPEERLLFAKALDQAAFSLKRNRPAFTDFFRPEEAARFLTAMQRQEDLCIRPWGGWDGAERVMLGFCPAGQEMDLAWFPLAAVEIRWNKFSAAPGHRDILGSVLGLGIDRSKTGDILFLQDRALIFATAEMAAFIASGLERVGRAPVKCRQLSAWQDILPEEKTQQIQKTVSSMRLDAVLGAAFPLSRSKAQELIRAEKVSIQHQPVTKAEKIVQEGDLISVRGYGRVKVLQDEGKTKKDRIRITLLLY